jgi:3-hydroxyacyl-[acyl-carrier-protein] dehydratase
VASEIQTEIESLLPHRDPFLFVDDIEEFEAGARIVTRWDVKADMDVFRGHYPGEPILPGVLISEFAFQSGAILLMKSGDEHWTDKPDLTPVLAGIEKARFRQIVRPGASIRAEVVLDRAMSSARYMTAKITSDAGAVARIGFVLTMTPSAKSGDGDSA